MKALQTALFVIVLFARMVVAMLRRLTLGPRRPGWNFPSEIAQTALRTAILGSKWWGFAWLRELQALLPPDAAMLARVDFEIVDAGGVSCEWCRPKGALPDRTLLYLHGGGYVIGSVDGSRELVARLALGADAQVLVPNYRLAPEHAFPAANDDCLSVYRWLLRAGVAADRIVLAGDSAGGALCMDVLLGARDAGDALPAGALLFSPWVDPSADTGSMREQEPFDSIDRAFLSRCISTYMQHGDPSNLRVAPVRAVLGGLPPLMIAVGSCEMLLDQARELAKAATRAGVEATLAEYQGCFHTFQSLAAFIPTAEHALADGCRFVVARTKATAS